MQDAPNIVILTGAGISAESGLATFRGPDGLWEGHRVENVCTPEALARDPATVHHFYDARRAALASVAPNAAHDALARLDAEWPGDLLIVDRKSVVQGTSVSVRVELGGRRCIKKNTIYTYSVGIFKTQLIDNLI